MKQVNAWTLLEDSAEVTTRFHTASKSIEHPLNFGVGPDKQGEQVSDEMAMSNGLVHTVSVWVYRDNVAECTLSAYHYPDDDSTPVLVTTWDEGDLTSDDWVELTFDVTPNRGANKIRLTAVPGASIQSGSLFVDDVTFSVAAGITRKLRDALIADLDSVTQANGYRTTIQTTSKEPRMLQDSRMPAAYIHEGSAFESEVDTTCASLVTQVFALIVAVHAASGVDLLDDLMDDIVAAIGKSGSNLDNVDGVITARVAASDEVSPEEDVTEDTHLRLMTVVVTYSRTDGSL